MTTYFSINPNAVHLWCVNLSDFFKNTSGFFQLLQPDERIRAERLPLTIKQQFILARAFLRKILSLYTSFAPENLDFIYSPKGKPFLKFNPAHIEFNVSHSKNFAFYGLTINKPIGVDIEKKRKMINFKIAERFFSTDEVLLLKKTEIAAQAELFYELWSKKEALIKASGVGIFGKQLDQNWVVQTCPIHKDYAAAFATLSPITHVLTWCWDVGGAHPLNPK